MKQILITAKGNTEIKVKEDTLFVLDLEETIKPYGTTASGSSATPKINLESPVQIDLIFETPGVSAEILGLYKLEPKQSLHFVTRAIHKTHNTTCFTNIRGILMDEASSDYTGCIIIEKEGHETSSFLDHKVLVVGQDTKNKTQPILEIEANDVKASHGATTGRVDKDQIYYLQSRGLNKNEATDIIVSGFFDALLSKITDEEILESVSKSLMTKI